MAKKNILHLSLKKQWFDLIASGIKKQEFREMSMYWYQRLTHTGKLVDDPNKFKTFDEIHFTNGYNPKKNPFLRVVHLKTDITPPKLITYKGGTKLHLKTSSYVLHLGEILEVKNWKNDQEIFL